MSNKNQNRHQGGQQTRTGNELQGGAGGPQAGSEGDGETTPAHMVKVRATANTTAGGVHRLPGDVFLMEREKFDSFHEAGQVEKAG